MRGLPSRRLLFVAAGMLISLMTLLSSTPTAALSPLPFPTQVAQGAAPANPPAITMQEAGKPLERELNAGQTHSYQVSVTEAQHISVIVEQRGVDVVIKCFGLDGKLVADTDMESRPNGEERAELVAQTTGSYRFDVEPRYEMLPGGRYEIRIVDVRPATGSGDSGSATVSVRVNSHPVTYGW